MSYRGVQMEQMDPDGILRGMPDVVVIDELAHTGGERREADRGGEPRDGGRHPDREDGTMSATPHEQRVHVRIAGHSLTILRLKLKAGMTERRSASLLLNSKTAEMNRRAPGSPSWLRARTLRAAGL